MPEQLTTAECIKRLYAMLKMRESYMNQGILTDTMKRAAISEMEALGCAIGTMEQIQKLVQSGAVEVVQKDKPLIHVVGRIPG